MDYEVNCWQVCGAALALVGWCGIFSLFDPLSVAFPIGATILWMAEYKA